MPISTRKQDKKIGVVSELSKAARALRAAADKATSAAEALEALTKALKTTKTAEQIAGPTEVTGGKVKRDALPSKYRRRLQRLAEQIEGLMEEIRRIPVTREQRALAKVEMAKRKERKA